MSVPGIAISRYIDFFTDFAFKKIFGTEANKDLLISFLNGLLDLEGEKVITDLTYMNTEQLGRHISGRWGIYDVYCQTKSGDHFIVEMQKENYFKKRELYYPTFAIRELARKGSQERLWDCHMTPVYVVGILYYVMDDSNATSNKVITKVTLKDDEDQEFSDKVKFIFIEMPKFRKQENELKTFIDKWIFALRNLCCLTEMPASLTEEIFKKLFSVAEIASFTQRELSIYEESLKNARDMYCCLISAKNQGRAEGLAEARAKRRAEATAEGEAKKTIEIVQSLKNYGIDYQTISEVSGMSVEEIEKL